MNGYIQKVLLKYGHPRPSKAKLSPHKHREVIYFATEKLTHEDDTSPPLDNQGKKRIQGIVGVLLYYDISVDKSYYSALVPLDPRRPPQQNAPTRKSIRYLITMLHTPPMEFYIDPVTWLCVHIMTHVFTMKAKDAADQGLKFSCLKKMPCPDVTAPFSLFPKSLNLSCPLLQKQNWWHFSS